MVCASPRAYVETIVQAVLLLPRRTQCLRLVRARGVLRNAPDDAGEGGVQRLVADAQDVQGRQVRVDPSDLHVRTLFVERVCRMQIGAHGVQFK